MSDGKNLKKLKILSKALDHRYEAFFVQSPMLFSIARATDGLSYAVCTTSGDEKCPT